VVYKEAGDEELYDRRKDRWELDNVADDPAYASVKARLQRKLAKLDRCAGRSCHISP
jgi:N-acetylglucosamine-6-sulfatase